MRHFDAVVVGCGAMGSSISYNLAARGMSVLTLEKFNLNHEFGSSHGRTRIIRLAYFEDPRYVSLLRRAFESWRELSAKSGKKLLLMTGGLMIGLEGGTFVSGVLKSAREHSLPHKVLKSREVTEAYPAFRLEEGHSAVYDENAGILFFEECISAYVEAARAAGCQFKFSEPATRWRSAREGVEVETAKDKYAADKLVLSAGAWTGQLLGDMVPLTIERQTPFWFWSGGDQAFSAGRMPIFIMEETQGHYFYGIPEVGHGVKVARNHEGEFVDPELTRRTVTESDEMPVREFVSRRLPKLNNRPISSSTCLYSNTPDWNFVIDVHPRQRDVVVVSACSGHGFKFASVIGEIGADLALDGRTRHDISFLRLERFSK
ncbi:MAG: N-methyl-L-tryptophan oxidase [Nitrososphaerales archaeon]|nr:N-methyl-L-tryptophan oxidase [Nitrososphaerales archaeon]